MAETKKSGRYQLACGHEVTGAVDVTKRHRCPTCRADTMVIPVIR